ncbi:peroxisomal N(1)-acetyl-spermine/spermidine oxidase-like [Pectinophora gossypiella]|nr:peroxisomal N(1)-acetyl-spermine/spermidine oxidase-like [Pectinophora gossypiella]
MIVPWVLVALALVALNCAEETNHYDVIVVGMGAAGTMAASTLARAGKKVLALEAMERVGGRVHSVDFAGGVAELGAEWTQGQGPSLIYKTARDHNITLQSQAKDLSEVEVVRSDGTLADLVIKDIVDKGMELCDEGSEGNKPVSLGEYVTNELTEYIRKKHPEIAEDKETVARVLEYLDQYTDTVDASDSWMDVDATVPYEILDGDQHLSWHKLGYKTLFELLLNTYNGGPGLDSLEVKLSSPVTSVKWPQQPDEKVVVTTSGGQEYTADAAIITVSLGVLKEKHTTLFSPALPEDKKTAIEKLDMGVIGKIIFSFDKPWWRNRIFGMVWKTEDLKKVPAEDLWTTKVMGASPSLGSDHTFTVWTGGATARLVETLPDEEVKTKVMALLRRFFGADTTIPDPTGMLRSKWYNNEWTRGSYSFTGMSAAQAPGARSSLAAPLSDNTGRPRVLLAGEATHATRYATVHGAADSGFHAASILLVTKTAA